MKPWVGAGQAVAVELLVDFVEVHAMILNEVGSKGYYCYYDYLIFDIIAILLLLLLIICCFI